MISLILVGIAAICNAVMDVLQFHYKQSIFDKYNSKWWNPAISWKNKYVDWDNYLRNRKQLNIFNLFYIDYPIFLTDAWHFFKSSMIVLLGLAIVFYNPVINIYVDIVLIGIVWNMVFKVFYSKFFRK